MIPESIPVFTVDDIIEPPASEYEQGKQKSTIGWLKYLFLFSPCEGAEDCIQITPKDWKEYKEALALFRKVNDIAKSVDLHDWEDNNSRKEQAAALNKLRRKMGYTRVIDR